MNNAEGTDRDTLERFIVQTIVVARISTNGTAPSM